MADNRIAKGIVLVPCLLLGVPFWPQLCGARVLLPTIAVWPLSLVVL